jgi:hypothetical protein
VAWRASPAFVRWRLAPKELATTRPQREAQADPAQQPRTSSHHQGSLEADRPRDEQGLCATRPEGCAHRGQRSANDGRHEHDVHDACRRRCARNCRQPVEGKPELIPPERGASGARIEPRPQGRVALPPTVVQQVHQPLTNTGEPAVHQPLTTQGEPASSDHPTPIPYAWIPGRRLLALVRFDPGLTPPGLMSRILEQQQRRCAFRGNEYQLTRRHAFLEWTRKRPSQRVKGGPARRERPRSLGNLGYRLRAALGSAALSLPELWRGIRITS